MLTAPALWEQHLCASDFSSFLLLPSSGISPHPQALPRAYVLPGSRQTSTASSSPSNSSRVRGLLGCAPRREGASNLEYWIIVVLTNGEKGAVLLGRHLAAEVGTGGWRRGAVAAALSHG